MFVLKFIQTSFIKLTIRKTKEEVLGLELKLVPTPGEFIYHIASEIRDDFSK